MPKYVMFLTLTPVGATRIEELPGQLTQLQDKVEGTNGLAEEDSLHGKVESSYFLMGRYDAVVTIELADNGLAMVLAAWVNRHGFFTATTSPAWDSKDWQTDMRRK